MPHLDIEIASRKTFYKRTAPMRRSDYVQRPSFLMRSTMEAEGRAQEMGPVTANVSPFEFILRSPQPSFVHYDDHETPPPWTLFVVAAQYGMGKTVFAQILLDLVDDDRLDLSSFWCVVPVPLSACRDGLGSNPMPDSLEDLVAAAGLSEFDRVRPEPRRLLLVLDGLDELVNGLESYRNFFQLVRAFLDAKRRQGIDADVLVLVRIELIRSVDGASFTQLLNSFNPASRSHSTVYVLAFDFFDRTRIVDYFHRHLTDDIVSHAIRQIDRDPDLMQTLKRPLQLKIFCELAQSRDLDKLTEQARVPAGLIEAYVDSAQITGDDNQQLAKLETTWDLERLAEEALILYRTAKPGFYRKDIRKICGLDEKSAAIDEFHLILKCPFLQRMDEIAIFSHRLFLEFFVARGMADRAENDDIEAAREFNELVLNVDMRQILRYFVNGSGTDSVDDEETAFHALTRYSYGLLEGSANDWVYPSRPLNPSARQRLDEIRSTLLDAMTFPLLQKPKFLTAIRDFFGEERNPLPNAQDPNIYRDLDPRYLMFCYESIATYLIYNPDRSPDHTACEEEFIERASRRLRCLVSYLERAEIEDPGVIRRHQLLLERLISIARRLGIGRGRLDADLIARIRRLVQASWDEDSRKRLTPSLDALGALVGG